MMSGVQLDAVSAMDVDLVPSGEQVAAKERRLRPKENRMQTICDMAAEVNKNHASGAVALAKGFSSKSTILCISASLRKICCAASSLLFAAGLCPVAQANGMQPVCPLQEGHVASRTITRPSLPGIDDGTSCASS